MRTFSRPPTIATPAAATSTPKTGLAPTVLCSPPYLAQPLSVSKGKNRKAAILSPAGKKRRVSVEEFNHMDGHHGAADSAVLSPSMDADEDPMVGPSTTASQAPPPPAPTRVPSDPWRPATPPADMWKSPLVLSSVVSVIG